MAEVDRETKQLLEIADSVFRNASNTLIDHHTTKPGLRVEIINICLFLRRGESKWTPRQNICHHQEMPVRFINVAKPEHRNGVRGLEFKDLRQGPDDGQADIDSDLCF